MSSKLDSVPQILTVSYIMDFSRFLDKKIAEREAAKVTKKENNSKKDKKSLLNLKK